MIRGMNRANVTDEMLGEAFTTYGADHELAIATLLQCSTEIHVVVQAMLNGCADSLVETVLTGIAQRMEVAAHLASVTPQINETTSENSQ